ncbi:PAS domain S-box protein [Anabaena sp. 4-3]|uniref:PAS domain S-box protein n=1 Tax=Anabaena sp. 4-3 TaxID=1811979 RepID=UPI0008337777|nr:PAS domain S-box protein [Anabaena sp. 4-3]
MSTKFFSTSDIEQTILPDPFTLTATTPAIEAVQLMSQVRDTCHLNSASVQSDVNLLNHFHHSEQASCVLVVEDNKLVGIFTEKDIVKCTAMGLDLETATLAEVMSNSPVTLKKSQFTNIFIALNLFRQYKIRHLAVVDDHNHIIGLVTPTTVRQLLQAADLLKMRSVDEVMTGEVIQAPPTASVLELAQLMTENAVSCVVITNSDSQPIGIVTERDIVQIRALDLNIRDIQANIVMSAPLFYMRQEQSLWEAHQQMQQRRIRRLVVVGGSNELLGIVTQTSVLSVLDPLKMYETVNSLQQTVCKLETEKVEILEKQNAELERQVAQRTAKLIQQANTDRLLANLSQNIRNTFDIESILQTTVSEIRAYLQTDRVVIYQFEPQWTGKIVAESLAPGKTSIIGRMIYDPCFATSWVEPYMNGQVRKIEDIYAYGLANCHIELLEQAEIRANLIVPIVYNQQLWGLLCAHQCSQPRYWETLEVELLEKLSSQIAIAIQQSQLYQQAQKELRERQQAEIKLKKLNEELEEHISQRLQELQQINDELVQEIVERKRVEQELRYSENRVRDILNSLFTFVGIINTDGILLEANRAPLEIANLRADDVINKPFSETYWWSYSSEVQTQLQQAIIQAAQGHNVRYDALIRGAGEELITIDLSLNPIFDVTGKVNYLVASGIDITERKQAEQILQKQLTAIEASIDGIAIVKDDKFIFLNKSHVQLFGYDHAQELIGKSWRELYTSEEIARLARDVFPILLQEGHWRGEATAQRRDGTTFHEEVSLTLTQDGELICVCRDITESRQAQKQLQKLVIELSNFKHALDQAAIVAITDPEGTITYANDNLCKISQYSRAELIGKTHSIINSGYHSKEYFHHLWSTITKGEVWRGEIKNRAKDGSYYWVDTTIVPFLKHNGKPWQYLAIHNDITNRKQAESDLQESEEKFRQLAENIHQVFWITDTEQLQMLYISPAYEEIWGRTCASLYKNPKSFMEAIYADDRQQCAMAMQNKKQGFDIEYRIVRPDGSMRWIRDQAFPLKDETGKVYRVIGIAEDITKSKVAAVALERSQNFLRQVIDTNPNIIFVKDLQGRFILANQALANLYGKKIEKLIGKTEADFNSNPSEVAYFKLINQQVIRTLQPHTIPERIIITASGETRYFQTIISPLIAPDGKAYQILGVLTDITERKQAEQEISKALEREKELGELKSRFVSMTSHEFRTPLSVISSSAAILKDFGHKLDDTKKKKHLDCIQTYVKHTTQLLDDILLIHKAENGKLAFEPAPLDLISFCQQLTEEIQLSAPNHTIVFSSHPQTGVIGNMDKKLLRQILINLLSNAIKYSPNSATVNFNVKITESNVILMSIQDQGIGIPETDQVKLFESFHRARNVGNIPGTGLGLSIVAKCVALHQGSISVNSQVGMGTTFIVEIPLQSVTFLPGFLKNPDSI